MFSLYAKNGARGRQMACTLPNGKTDIVEGIACARSILCNAAVLFSTAKRT
jgi:hypothetical protein